MLLIFLALFVPTTYKEIKSVLLVGAIVCIVLTGFYSKLVWTQETILASVLFASFGLLNSWHGAINSAPGAISVLSVMSVWPLLYGLFSAMVNNPDAMKMMVNTFYCSLVAVIAYSFLYLGNVAEIVPASLYFEIDQGQMVGFYDGRVEFNLYSISSLLYLLPFWMHYIFILNKRGMTRWHHWIFLVLGLLLAVVTGRRAVQLVVFASPVLMFFSNLMATPKASNIKFHFITLLKARNIFSLFAFVIAFLLLLFAMDVRMGVVLDDLISGFDFKDGANVSASERSYQFQSLISSWINGNFLFGAGNGSHTSYLRSEDMPWAYELTYIYILFSNGVIGAILYSFWFVWGLLRVRRELMKRIDLCIYVAPMITGVLGLGIGAASNPYFAKFDYLWIIFLPHLLAGGIKYQKPEI